MSYVPAKVIEVSEIPVVDVGALRGTDRAAIEAVARELRRASASIGFFYVRDHGVPEQVIRRADRAARAFFALPEERKGEVAVNRHHHGYLRIGEARMADDVKPDLKESFVWGLELPEDDAERETNPFLGPNNWPAFLPELRNGLYPFFEETIECAKRVMRAFAISLGLPEDAFIQRCTKPIARGSALCYSSRTAAAEAGEFGVAPHTDYGCLTLLWQDDVGGLEVKTTAGEWVTAHPIPGTLVVNVGDLLARWSNDEFVSTPHRVVNRKGVARHSMVLAFDPDFDTVVDPAVACRAGETPKYPAVTCGAYVLGRFDAAFSYRKKRHS